MTQYLTTDISCGVHQLVGMHADPRSIIQLAKGWNGNCAFYVFSDTVGSGGAKALVDYIKKAKLGHVTLSKPKRNPNTKNAIHVGVWQVNHGALSKWKR